jgi:pimeloyl-ACP methyl ester carboxylesterase
MTWRGACARLAIGLVVLVVLVIGGFRLAAAWREATAADVAPPPNGHYVATRSGRIFVQEAGPANGTPVVLFHGTAAWSEFWRKTLTALGDAGFRAIAVDLPPFGFSDRPTDNSYNRAAQAARVREVLDRLGIERVIVVGHSFGAGAAVETVLHDLERVRGVVLIDAALGLTGTPSDAKPPFYLKPRWLREALVALTVTNPLMTRHLLAMMVAKQDHVDEYAEIVQRPLARKGTTRDIATWLLYFMVHDSDAVSADRAAYAKMPRTAVLWGEKDTVTPLDQAEDLRRLIPGATLTVLPGLGHIPQIEDPDALNKALIERLRAFN